PRAPRPPAPPLLPYTTLFRSVCALALHITRGAVFTRYALLGADAVKVGLVLGAVMFGGSWIGRRLLDRMSDRVFLAVIEALLVVDRKITRLNSSHVSISYAVF